MKPLVYINLLSAMKKKHFSRVIILLSFIPVFCTTPVKENEDMHISNINLADSSLLIATSSPAAVVLSDIATIKAIQGPGIFEIEIQGRIEYDRRSRKTISSRISGRIENLYVKYNFEEVKKGQLIMEIYSNDLIAAQKEFLLLSKNNENALALKAKQKLLLLGFPENLIQKITVENKPLYKIPVYATHTGFVSEPSDDNLEDINQAMIASPLNLKTGRYIKAGEKLFNLYDYSKKVVEIAIPANISANISIGKRFLYKSLSGNEKWQNGNIDLLLPVQRNNENFKLSRTYINNNKYKKGELVAAVLPIVITSGYWLPEQAVYFSGKNSIVFKKEKGVFKPVKVATGFSYNGQIQVTDNIENWELAENAKFLTDSESFINYTEYEK